MRFSGLESVRHLMSEGLTAPGEWRLVPIWANRQPAAASFLREWGGSEFRAFKIDVLRIAEGKIREITTFGPSRFPDFGLPEIFEATDS
jgi:RNA polymerase sigma-70 factor (ECF subfamily)